MLILGGWTTKSRKLRYVWEAALGLALAFSLQVLGVVRHASPLFWAALGLYCCARAFSLVVANGAPPWRHVGLSGGFSWRGPWST